MARPRGEVACALLEAARAGPGTATELGARALVGRTCLSYTVSRLVAGGHLVVVERRHAQSGPGRPAAVLALPERPAADGGQSLADVLSRWR